MTAGHAVLAVIAVAGRLGGHRIPGPPSGYTRSRFHNHSGRLVSQHHGINAAAAADPALGVGVHVGAAYAHSLDADLDFARTGLGLSGLSQPEAPEPDQFGDAHRDYFDPFPACGGLFMVSFAM